MSRLKIKDMPPVEVVDGTEIIPTGGKGDVSVTVQRIKNFVYADTSYLALQSQLSTVDLRSQTTETNLNSHVVDLNNPHQVTKSQVGLGNVDNTSDVNKPISTLTQTALDLKANTSYVDSIADVKANITYVDNGLATKEPTLVLNATDLIPTSSFDAVKDTNSTVIDSVAQSLLNRTEYLKTHNNLVGRDSTNAHTDLSITTWSGRTQEGKNKDVYSIDDFKLPEDLDYSAALQRAVAPNRSVFFPRGTYVFKDLVTIDQPNFRIYGDGELAWADDGVAGSTCILVSEDDFDCIGLKHRCLTTRRAFFRVNNSLKDIYNFLFDSNKFYGGFYSVRGGLTPSQNPNNTYIHNLQIVNNISTAPTDVPAGHFLTSSSKGTKYIGNSCFGGTNTSVYGINFSDSFVIVGNLESGVTPYLTNGAEASIQIEDCDLANGIISNNVCSHDIWVSGANNILVQNNQCMLLRITVGNATGKDVYNTTFKYNKCCSVSIAKFGAEVITNTYSCDIENNIIDPQYSLNLGRTVPTRAISIQGQTYGKDINIVKNKVISSAGTNQVSVVRGDILNLRMIDNDFGSGTHITSSTGGYILDHGNINPVFPHFVRNSMADIGLTYTADKVVATSSTWVKLTNFTKTRDLNSKADATTGLVELSSGIYSIEVKLGIAVTTAENTVGLRVVDQVGVELSRLRFEKARNTASVMYSGIATITAPSSITGIFFEAYSEQNITISGNTALSNISIVKLR